MYGNLISIHSKPGDKFDNSGRPNKKDTFSY
jgi:hypothetical protein